MAREKFHFIADSKNKKATDVLDILLHTYKQYDIAKADVIVALGGDGFMLHTLHQAMELETPVFGLNFGSVGFLMNVFDGLFYLIPKNLFDILKCYFIHFTLSYLFKN